MEPLEKPTTTLIYCWGLGAEGQLGEGSSDNSSIPLQSKLVSRVTDVSAGGQFSAAVTQDGSLFMWGSNKKNQLAFENTEKNYPIPTKVKGLANIIKVACGDWHSVVIDSQGIGYSVGYNKSGCLGLGDNENRSVFSAITVKEPARFVGVAAGRNISLLLREEGELWSCGSGGMNGNSKEDVNALLPIETLKKTQIRDFSAGFSCCACVDNGGNLWTWGDSEDYQLGHGTKLPSIIPKVVEKLSKIVQVSCSRGDKHCHMGCVDGSGCAFSWGSGYKAKLGHGDSKDQTLPKAIEYFSKENIRVRQFIAGGIHSSCLAEDGTLYTFGCGSDGRLGHPEKGNHKYLYKEKFPKAIEALKGVKVEKAFSSYYHMIALTTK